MSSSRAAPIPRLAKVLLLGVFIAAPLIDALTGIALFTGRLGEGGVGSLSQLLRALCLIAGLSYIRNHERIIVLMLLLWIAVIELWWTLLHQNVTGGVTGFVYSTKLVYLVTLAFAFRKIIQKTSAEYFLRWYACSVIFYAALTIVPTVLGINLASYGADSFGSKGLFASGNGLGIFLGISALVLFVARKQFSSSSHLFGAGALLALPASIFVATKAAGAIAVLIAARAFARLRPLKMLAVGLATVALVQHSWTSIEPAVSLVFEVAVFRFERSESIAEFVASGRIDYVSDALAQADLSGLLGSVRMLVGGGSYMSFRNHYDDLSEYDTLETDLFDIFFSYGVLGVTAYLTLVIAVGRQLWLRRQYGWLLAWLALTGQSMLAGHVLYDGMSSGAAAVIAALAYGRPVLRRDQATVNSGRKSRLKLFSFRHPYSRRMHAS